MNAAELSLLIRANDQASKTIRDVGNTADESFNRAERSASGLGSTIGSVGKIASGVFAAGALTEGVGKVTDAIGESIAGWKEQLKVSAQTEAVLKSTGQAAGLSAKQIEDNASALKANSLFADDAIQSGENLLLTFTNIGKDTFPGATQAMLDMSQAMGQDLGTSAIQLGKALNNPKDGLSALQRVGVTFNDQQKEQVAAMQDAGDMAGAQAIILAELNKEFGGSAKAASDAAGASATYADKMDDLNDTMGQKLLPIQEKWKELQLAVVEVIISKVFPAIERFSTWAAPKIQEFSDAAGKQFARFQEYWETSIKPALDNLQAAFEKLSPVILPIVKEIGNQVETTAKVIQDVLNIVIALLGGDFSGAWDGVKKLVDDIATGITNSLGNMKDLALGALGLLQDGATEKFTALKDGAIEKAQELLDWIAGLASKLLDAVGDLATLLLEKGRDLLRGLWNGVKALWGDAGGLLEWLIGFGNRVLLSVGNLELTLFDAGVSIVQGLIDGVKSMLGGVVSAVGSVISAIPDTAKKILKIFSPSQVMHGLGRNIAEGLSNGMTEGMTKLTLPRVAVLAQAIPAAAGRGIAAARGSGAAGGAGGGLTLNLSVTAPLGTPAQVAAAVLDALVHLERRGGLPPGTTRGLAA